VACGYVRCQGNSTTERMEIGKMFRIILKAIIQASIVMTLFCVVYFLVFETAGYFGEFILHAILYSGVTVMVSSALWALFFKISD
jgi:hypothetical protein